MGQGYSGCDGVMAQAGMMPFGPYLALSAWVAGPVILGMLLRRIGVPRTVSRRLFAWALYFFQTGISFLAVWVARLGGEAMLLPAIALVGWLVAAGSTWLADRAFDHTPAQRGAFLMTGCMSNHGYTLLGIVAFMLFGEAGLAQATYVQFFFIPFMVLFCFPVARSLGKGADIHPRHFWRQMLFDSRNLPLVAMVLGLGLNLGGVPRPDLAAPFLKLLVYSGTIISGVAVGLQLRRSQRSYLGENIWSLVLRSTLYPGCYLLMAWALGLDGMDTRILILYGLVPSALFSNLVSDLFGLDTDLTNAVFVGGTAIFLVVVLPLYAWLALAY